MDNNRKHADYVRGVALALMLFVLAQDAAADSSRERWRARHATAGAADTDGELNDGSMERGRATVSPGVQVQRDVAYGADRNSRYDVYIPAGAHQAPIIFMVHGGGWKRGDKAMANTVQNKVARWAPKGFIVVSINYRMLPDMMALEQAKEVAAALASVQTAAAGWGGDPTKVILMGHSAGAHLVSMVNSSPTIASAAGAKPFLGTVSLDTAMMNVPAAMTRKHRPLYDAAFGTDPAYWAAASPYNVLVSSRPPLLAVCGSERRDKPCADAQAFAVHAQPTGTSITVLPKAMNHSEINSQLGLPGAYTDAVETFMRGLDPVVASHLLR